MSFREYSCSIRASGSLPISKEEHKTMIDDLNAKISHFEKKYEALSATMKKEEIERKEVCDGMNTTIENDKVVIRKIKKEIEVLNRDKTKMVKQILRLTTGSEEDQLNEKIIVCVSETKRRSTEDYEEKINNKAVETEKLSNDIKRLTEERDKNIVTKKSQIEALKTEYNNYQAEATKEIKKKEAEIKRLKAKLDEAQKEESSGECKT